MTQTKTQHTPGPWQWDVDETGFTYEVWGFAADHMTRHVCEVFRFDEWGREKDNAELEANARLIAAAPEMLEALKGLLANAPKPKGIKDDFSYILYLEAASTAIAKAEGRGQ